MPNRVWPVWKTVRIGMPGFCRAEDLLKEFIEGNSTHDPRVKAIIETLGEKLVVEEQEINLALVGPKHFGLPGGTKRSDFFQIMQKSGLTILPAVAGFCLRKQYTTQPETERFHMAMDQISLPKFGPCGLFLYGSFITGGCADCSNSLMAECRFACGIA